MPKIPHSQMFKLLRGTVSAAQVARELGLSVEAVEALQASFVDGLEAGRAASGGRRSFRRAAMALTVVTAVLLAPRAFSGTCATPSFFSNLGLNFLCANDPAVAADLNSNTQQLATLMTAKVGALGPAAGGNSNISTGTITTSGLVTAPRAAISYEAPPYASWDVAQVGAGGAAIVNDNVGYKALMVVGNTSAGGSRRQVKVFDDLTVTGRLSVTDKQCRSFDSGCQGTGTLEFLDRHTLKCNADEAMQGLVAFNCGGGNVKLTVTCCKY